MRDQVGEAVTQYAEQLAAGMQIPPVGEVRRRLEPRPAGRTRRMLAPAVAVVTVLGVVMAAQLVPSGSKVSRPVVPAAPSLGTVAPPLVVATRLGAPSGHLNGPAVERADELAVSPTVQDGLTLRTVATTTARVPRPGETEPLVNRCTYTYTDPGAAVLEGGCEIAIRPLASSASGVSFRVLGGPGRTFLLGTAPPGTAAVLLQSAGRADLLVPTAPVPGGSYGPRPAWVSWWPRTETAVVALDADGAELARSRLPSPTPVRAADDDPELGTVELDQATGERGLSMMTPGQPPHRETEEPLKVDVLTRLQLAPDVVLFTYGLAAPGRFCTFTVVQDLSAGPARRGGDGGGCGPTAGSGLRIGRSSHPDNAGGPGQQLLTGSAPAGTERVVLRAPGLPPESVEMFDGGVRWADRVHFATQWPAAAPTNVQALDAAGQVLAEVSEAGLDLDAFDSDYLEAYARCLETAGIAVSRLPQPGTSPGYSYNLSSLPADRRASIEQRCAQLGKAAVK